MSLLWLSKHKIKKMQAGGLVPVYASYNVGRKQPIKPADPTALLNKYAKPTSQPKKATVKAEKTTPTSLDYKDLDGLPSDVTKVLTTLNKMESDYAELAAIDGYVESPGGVLALQEINQLVREYKSKLSFNKENLTSAKNRISETDSQGSWAQNGSVGLVFDRKDNQKKFIPLGKINETFDYQGSEYKRYIPRTNSEAANDREFDTDLAFDPHIASILSNSMSLPYIKEHILDKAYMNAGVTMQENGVIIQSQDNVTHKISTQTTPAGMSKTNENALVSMFKNVYNQLKGAPLNALIADAYLAGAKTPEEASKKVNEYLVNDFYYRTNIDTKQYSSILNKTVSNDKNVNNVNNGNDGNDGNDGTSEQKPLTGAAVISEYIMAKFTTPGNSQPITFEVRDQETLNKLKAATSEKDFPEILKHSNNNTMTTVAGWTDPEAGALINHFKPLSEQTGTKESPGFGNIADLPNAVVIGIGEKAADIELKFSSSDKASLLETAIPLKTPPIRTVLWFDGNGNQVQLNTKNSSKELSVLIERFNELKRNYKNTEIAGLQGSAVKKKELKEELTKLKDEFLKLGIHSKSGWLQEVGYAMEGNYTPENNWDMSYTNKNGGKSGLAFHEKEIDNQAQLKIVGDLNYLTAETLATEYGIEGLRPISNRISMYSDTYGGNIRKTTLFIPERESKWLQFYGTGSRVYVEKDKVSFESLLEASMERMKKDQNAQLSDILNILTLAE